MTKRNPAKPPRIPPNATEEEIVFLRHRERDLKTAMAGSAMAAVNSGKFGRADLAAIAHYLVNIVPDRIPSGQMTPYIRLIIERFAADNPSGRPRKEAIDTLTRLWRFGNGMPLAEVHRLVAMIVDKAPSDVRQDRYRVRKGRKSSA